MTRTSTLIRDILVFGVLLLATAWWCAHALAAEAGRIKTAKGDVQIERGGKVITAVPGALIEVADTVRTGKDGAVGIAFLDNSLLSAGPNSELVVEKFLFDSRTDEGAFDTRLKKGTLGVVSGRIVKQTPEAMRVKTPSAVMGVRGTEFIVRVDQAATN
jgi:hypothetical protein